jgi:CRISPR-associated protein Cas1
MAPGVKLRAESGMLCIERDGAPASRFAVSRIRAVVAGPGVIVSSPALSLLAEGSCPFIHLGRGGRVRYWIGSCARPTARVVLAQARMESDRASGGPGSQAIVRELIGERIRAMDALLAQHERTERTERPDGYSDVAHLRRARRQLREHINGLATSQSIDEARGFEGAASAAYFACMGSMLTGDLRTARRSRRPPRDPVNAMLSLGYSLLVAEALGTVVAHGLNPELGLLHPPDFRGRPSIALDLVEPLRISIIDRLVISLCNRRRLCAADFATDPSAPEGIAFTDEGRHRFLACYQEAMESEVLCPDGSTCSVRDLVDRSVRWYLERIDHD